MPRPHRILRLLAVVAVLAVVLPGRHAAADTPNLTVDSAQTFQRIDGLGVNANSAPWNNGQLAPALGLLRDTLGAKTWRVIVEDTQNWEDTPPPNPTPTTYNWAYYDQIYETPKFQSLWGVLGYLQQKQVPTIMLNVMGYLPDWFGTDASGVFTSDTIAPNHEDDWVTMVTSLVAYAVTTKHLRLDIVSPMNEEDTGYPEGPAVGTAQYTRLMDKLSARLDTLGLGGIRLLGPEAADVDRGVQLYAPAMYADPSLMAKVDHLGLHNYAGDTDSAASLLQANAAAYPNRDFWMTEFSASCGTCDTGGQVPDEWDFSTSIVDNLLSLLEQGAASALVYDAYDSVYEHHGAMGYWGLLAYDPTTGSYTPRKRFWATAQVDRFLPAGALRIGASTSLVSLPIVAFSDQASGRLTIVGRNQAPYAQTLSGALANLPAPSAFQYYETTASEDMVRGPDLPVTNGAFSVTVPPDSIFTLTAVAPVAGATATATSTATPAGTATPTASPSATSTATPAAQAVGGANLALQAQGGASLLSWAAGTAQTGYLVARSSLASLALLPTAGTLPASATAYTDWPPATDLYDCYAVVALNGIASLGNSDFLCRFQNVQSAAGAPAGFAIQLNQTQTATLSWAAPGGQTGYVLGSLTPSVPGAGWLTTPLLGGVTSTSFHMNGQTTCFVLLAQNGAVVTGNTDMLCGVPGQATLAAQPATATRSLSQVQRVLGQAAQQVRPAAAKAKAATRAIRPATR